MLPVISGILLIILALGYFIYRSDFKLPDDYYDYSVKEISSGDKTVFIKISCETVLDNMDKLDSGIISGGYIPEDGIILPKTEYVLEENDSVFSILLRAARHNRIHLDFTGNTGDISSVIYVKGINHIYEYSCGPLSGWLFKVNGEFSSKESSGHLINDGDFVEWIYTCDLGRDVGSIYFEDTSE